MTNGYGAMPDYAAQINPGGPLGNRGLHSRAAVQPERTLADVPPGVRYKI